MQKRYQQFQRRLARHYLNADVANDKVETEDQVKERKALKTLSQSSSAHSRHISNRIASSNSSNVVSGNKSKEGESSSTFKIFSSSENLDSTQEGSWKNLGSEVERNRENAGILLSSMLK